MAALPHGTGKKVKVAVFADGLAAEEARKAGADLVGGEDLIATIKAGGSGAIDFDKASGPAQSIRTPDDRERRQDALAALMLPQFV